ncbi:MAG TPA: VWA domain-containing protein [Casimicrobiaceae bacterium]|nr:VWA domain-containing protein [Casimicrobiaceae bacterium]
MLITAPIPAALDPAATLRSRLTGFSGFLHANGFGVGGGDSARVLATAAQVGILDREVLRWSLKALLCGRVSEWRRFDPLFDAYFLPPNRKAFVEGAVDTPRQHAPAGAADDRGEASPAKRSKNARDEPLLAAHYGASREESLATTDFRELVNADHVRDIEALMRRFARRLKHLQLRREARALSGRRIDLPGTIRRSVERGGTPLSLAWKDRRRIRPRLVLLLDVSRSMSAYSFFYLRLARALSAELADVHSYIFHTRITAVSEALRDADPWRAQEKMHLMAAGWGGGTRIGECLRAFNRDHAARRVHSRTAVIIVSDGYDTGEPETLAEALVGLRRRARRIVWINPLATRPGWSPTSRGMQAALPHVDLLAPGADLATLEHVLPDIIETLR